MRKRGTDDKANKIYKASQLKSMKIHAFHFKIYSTLSVIIYTVIIICITKYFKLGIVYIYIHGHCCKADTRALI